MNRALDQALTDRFREPNTLFLSPARISEFFGFQIQELAERANVHRNTPTARPHTPQLQTYLQKLIRVLAAATELTNDPKRAAFLIRNEPLRTFEFKTADTLIQEGRGDSVIAYLDSLAGGTAG